MQSCKFVFEQYSKIIEMDIPKRSALFDMKLILGKFLGISLFAKKLVFYLGDTAIDSSKPLAEAIGMIGEPLQQPRTQVQFIVKTEEVGA